MKHILVVDDEKINLNCASAALNGHYKVTTAMSGKQALQFLSVTVPDIVLLDINMPLMNGFEVMEQMRAQERTRRVPVAFMSAEKDAVTEGKCLEKGAVDFLPKPFVPSILLGRIDKIMRALDTEQTLTAELKDIRDKSQKDALTGLWNRNYTSQVVEERLRKGGKGALFMIDMDNFKAINDNYGHDAGDKTLKMFADTLRDHTGKKDVACRIGGDEFVAYIDSTVDKEKLGEIAGSIIKELCYKLEECKFDTNSSVSVGIAMAPEDGEDFTSLYNAADKALYHVKQNGKNAYHFFSDQSPADMEQAARYVDIRYFHELARRSDGHRGAYQVDLRGFQYVYNFLVRQAERGRFDTRTLLLNLMPDEGYVPEKDELDKDMELLEEALFNGLRRGDIFTRYSDKQVVLLLPETTEEEAKGIVARVAADYEGRYNGGKVHVYYETVVLK